MLFNLILILLFYLFYFIKFEFLNCRFFLYYQKLISNTKAHAEYPLIIKINTYAHFLGCVKESIPLYIDSRMKL